MKVNRECFALDPCSIWCSSFDTGSQGKTFAMTYLYQYLFLLPKHYFIDYFSVHFANFSIFDYQNSILTSSSTAPVILESRQSKIPPHLVYISVMLFSWTGCCSNNLLIRVKSSTSRNLTYIILTLKPHFYIVKLESTGVYIIFLISAKNMDCGYPQSMFWAEIWKYQSFLSENFHFLW